MEPVALQVRCIHCHRRRCNCAGCRCAAVTAIRHPARARSQLLRLTMGWHVLWSQWRCSIPTACDLRTAAFTATDADASRALATQVQLRDCHRRRCNSADCRCAAVTAIRHPARARSQLDSTHDGLARAVEPVALQVRCIHCHRRRCNSADRRALATCGGTVSAAAIDAGTTAPIAAAPL